MTLIRHTLDSFNNCIYWCMCDEIGGERQTPHMHLYMAFRNAVEFAAVQQHFHGAHIEGARGSHQENRDYIRKEGKWLNDDKHDINLRDTFAESGDLPEERAARAKQSEEILTMIEDGATNAEILRPQINLLQKRSFNLKSSKRNLGADRRISGAIHCLFPGSADAFLLCRRL